MLGLEPARPNLLLGLVICQKDKKRAGAPLDGEEKRSKTTRDPDVTGLLKHVSVTKSDAKQDKATRHSLDTVISTTPPGTPPALSSSEAASSSLAASSVFSLLSSIKAGAASIPTGRDSPSASGSSATPLQTILKTLFGKKKQDSEASMSPSDPHSSEVTMSAIPLLDPIVQQFGQKKENAADEYEDDRPYDPEEEYDPSMGYGAEKVLPAVKQPEVAKPAEATGDTEVDDVAYDPEDDSMFDDVSVEGGGNSAVMKEQQRMLDNLNKQIEDQKRQLEEQEGSLLASVPDPLISQPTQSLLSSSQLLQLGKQVEALVGKPSTVPVINQRRDPRQSRDPRQAAAGRRSTTESVEKEESPPQVSLPVVEATPPQSTPQQTDTAQTPQEEVKIESLPFLEADSTDVLIPLLGEKIEPSMVEEYMPAEPAVKSTEVITSETEPENNSFSIWPNSASILKEVNASREKMAEVTSHAQSHATASSESNPVQSITSLANFSQDLNQGSSSGMDSHTPHMPHMPIPSTQSDYNRGPQDVPPPMSYQPVGPVGLPPIHSMLPMQGPPPHNITLQCV